MGSVFFPGSSEDAASRTAVGTPFSDCGRGALWGRWASEGLPGITESFHKPRSGAGSSAERFLLFAARFSLLTPGLWSLYLQIEETRVNIDKISEHVEEAKRLYSVILSAPIPEPSECRRGAHPPRRAGPRGPSEQQGRGACRVIAHTPLRSPAHTARLLSP